MDWPEDEEKQDIPYVHIWMRFAKCKPIYPIDKSRAKVTEDELKHEDDDRWLEIPDDYLKTRLDDIFKDEEVLIVVERRQSKAQLINYKKETSKKLSLLLEEYELSDIAGMIVDYLPEIKEWPRSKGDDWLDTIQTGDIVDCKDEQDKWFESLVRYVYPKESDKYGVFIVHYIGWNIKWDEPLNLNGDRIAKRNTHSKGPHRPRKKKKYVSSNNTNNNANNMGDFAFQGNNDYDYDLARALAASYENQ